MVGADQLECGRRDGDKMRKYFADCYHGGGVMMEFEHLPLGITEESVVAAIFAGQEVLK